MVDANCTAKDRGHRKNSQRGRDCPATVHGGDGGNGTTAPSGAGAAATPSAAGAATTSSGTGAAAPSAAGAAVHGLGVGAAPSGAAGSGSSAATSNPTTSTAAANASAGDLTAGQLRVVEELWSVLLEVALAQPCDRDRTAALALWEKVAAEDKGSGVRRKDLCRLFNDHALCLLFEEIAVALKGLTGAIPELVGKMVEESTLPPLLKVVAKVLLSKATAIAITGLTASAETLRIKACVLAIALCPDPDPKSHRSPEGTLEQNCAIPSIAAATEPAENAR